MSSHMHLTSAACDATDITMKALSSAVGRNSQQGKPRNEYVRASTWIISPHKLKLIENWEKYIKRSEVIILLL